MKSVKLLILSILTLAPVPAWANIDTFIPPLQGRQDYQPHEFALPFTIRSSDSDDRLSADVSSEVQWPFADVAEMLSDPASWCEFIPLSPNIKSCVFARQAQQSTLTFYAGQKEYQPPKSAYQLDYIFRVAALNDRQMKVILSAKDGPFGTSHYRIVVEARPRPQGTLLQIHTSFKTSLPMRLGTRLYLATFGRDKIGFTVDGRNEQGDPIFIKGVRGVIERNAMRYYLALKVFLDTRHMTPGDRFETRIKTWFDLTENYAAQLRELERDSYLQGKRQEWRDQQELQGSIH